MGMVALISDIHGNLEALEKVLEVVKQEGFEPVYCLGDIVGYGPNPEECLQLVRSHCQEVIVGNHDEIVFTGKDPEWFNPLARQAILWTCEQVSFSGKEFLRQLRVRSVIHTERGNVVLTHGNLLDYFQSYVTNTFEAETNFAEISKGDIVFIGHTHRPLYFSQTDDEVELHPYQEDWLQLTEGTSYIINIGSVGQPRDHDPRASFLVWDRAGHRVRWHRVEYDYHKTQEKMRAADLPEFLIDRLALGK